jgi:Trk K+ transport system NAD-binding subunit
VAWSRAGAGTAQREVPANSGTRLRSHLAFKRCPSSDRLRHPGPWLGVRLRDEPSGVHQLTVTAGSPADGRTIGELAGLPGEAWVSFIVRDGQLVPVKAGTRLRPGDDVLVLADPDLHDKLARAFTRPSAQ